MILSCVSIIYHSNFLLLLIDILLHVANAMVGSRSWIGGLFHRTSTKRNNDKFVDYPLSPVEVKWMKMMCWISLFFSLFFLLWVLCVLDLMNLNCFYDYVRRKDFKGFKNGCKCLMMILAPNIKYIYFLWTHFTSSFSLFLEN